MSEEKLNRIKSRAPQFFFPFFLLISYFRLTISRSDEVETVTANNEGSQGGWKTTVYCPFGSFVRGFKMRVEDSGVSDPTELNSIEMKCYDYNNVEQGTINPEGGSFGDWYSYSYCQDTTGYVNFLSGYRMKTGNSSQGSMSMAGRCLSGYEFEPPGANSGGSWGSFSSCSAGTAVCGFNVKYEDYKGIFTDDSTLNHVRVVCCRLCHTEGGQYLNGNTCSLCHYTCKTCSGGGSNQCSSCHYSSTYAHSLSGNVCTPPSCK